MNIRIYFILFLFAFTSCKEDPKTEKTLDPFQKLTEMIADNPVNDAYRYQRAQMLYEAGKYDEAIEDMRVAILRDSMNVNYYHLLADIFLDGNNSSKSLLTMKKAGALFPDSVTTQLKLAETQYILKQYGEAILTLNEITRKQPQNAEAYFMLGLVFREMKDEGRAINAFQAATEFDSKLVDAWILLGNIFEGRKEKIAERYYRTAIAVDPEGVAAHHNLAFYLQNNGNVPEALEIYKQINLFAPRYGDAYLNAGALYLETKQNDLALEQFEILNSIDPKDAKAHYYKALAYKAMGDLAKMKVSAQNAVNLNPNFEEAKMLAK